jgi:hypothetical protein
MSDSILAFEGQTSRQRVVKLTRAAGASRCLSASSSAIR